jgi:hypothetical protein
MNATKEINEHLKDIQSLPFNELVQRWREIDAIVTKLAEDQQTAEWMRIVAMLENVPVGKGHAYFRLGILHLLKDSSEKTAVDYLEKAYREDEEHAPSIGQEAHRMGAYRLLALVKGYFQYLDQKRIEQQRKSQQPSWETEQFTGATRRHQVETLLIVYDKSLVHPLDLTGHTYQSFFQLIQDRSLSTFAIENYFCSEELITMLTVESQAAFRRVHEYPIARAIVGLLGGVIEAILAARIPKQRQSLPLGGLMKAAYEAGIIQLGSRLAALCSLQLYLRNHVHADRNATRNEYFIDLNVARGSKAAMDWVISEMLRTRPQQPLRSSTP